jgi:hypothetical protein
MTRRRVQTLLLFAALATAAASAPGCRKPLLAPEDERSQYDRYDSIRNQRAQQYVYDEFGRRRPNIRARLLSKD